MVQTRIFVVYYIYKQGGDRMKVRHQLMLEMFLILQSLFGFIVETEETTLSRKSQEEKRYESPIVRCGKR